MSPFRKREHIYLLSVTRYDAILRRRFTQHEFRHNKIVVVFLVIFGITYFDKTVLFLIEFIAVVEIVYCMFSMLSFFLFGRYCL